MLCNITLQRASLVTASAAGAFSDEKHDEVVVARGSSLELLRHDASGSLSSVGYTDVFAVVRCISVFRPVGTEVLT